MQLMRSGCGGVGENLIEITPTVQYPHDLSNIITHAIKDNVGTRGNRSGSRPYFVASAPAKWMIFDQPGRIVDFADDVVRPMPAGHLRIVVQISDRSARASGD